MKNRSTKDYSLMWNEILKFADESNYAIPDSPTIILDFEKASANSFTSLFPNGKILGCYFHFWQTIHKNLKKKQVYSLYKNDHTFNKKIKNIACLAFLPEEEVVSTLTELHSLFPPEAGEFLKYFDETFVRGKLLRTVAHGRKDIYGGPRYAVLEWNVFNRFEHDLERTSNMMESTNRQLQACNIHGNHPTLYRLKTLLLDYNQRMVHKMEDYITRGAPEPKKKKVVKDREENLKRLHVKYLAKDLSKDDYLFGCAGNVVEF